MPSWNGGATTSSEAFQRALWPESTIQGTKGSFRRAVYIGLDKVYFLHCKKCFQIEKILSTAFYAANYAGLKELMCPRYRFLKSGPFSASFFFIFVFLYTVYLIQLIVNKLADD